MKRTYAWILAMLAAAALFAGLVYAILHLAHLAEPAATTLHGPTVRRLWATGAAVLALTGTIVGGLALARPASRFASVFWKYGTMGAGVVATLVGGLVLAFARGGPGSGNGVVGGAAALVLGLTAVVLGVAGLARPRASD